MRFVWLVADPFHTNVLRSFELSSSMSICDYVRSHGYTFGYFSFEIWMQDVRAIAREKPWMNASNLALWFCNKYCVRTMMAYTFHIVCRAVPQLWFIRKSTKIKAIQYSLQLPNSRWFTNCSDSISAVNWHGNIQLKHDECYWYSALHVGGDDHTHISSYPLNINYTHTHTNTKQLIFCKRTRRRAYSAERIQ